MKMMMCFLLLLICSSSTAQPQTESEVGDPVNQPQSYGDIHAALREMSASLAELKVEMKILQRENEELIARSDVTENKVEALKRDGEVKQVAFSAALFDTTSSYVGPFNTNTPLVFAHVVTNIGNAYNSNTGVFTAPVRGAYHFDFYVGAYGDATHATGAILVKNQEHVFMAYALRDSGYGTVANGATLLLEVGDVVFLRLWQNQRVYDNQNHHNTFSGHLLFTM